jgi:hypothetical protein
MHMTVGRCAKILYEHKVYSMQKLKVNVGVIHMFYMNVKFHMNIGFSEEVYMNVGFCAEDLDLCGNRVVCKSLKRKLGFRQMF